MRLLASVVALVVAVVVRPWVVQHFALSAPSSNAASSGSSTPSPAANPAVLEAMVHDGSVWGEDWHVERLKPILVSPWSTLNASKVRSHR